MRSVFGGGNQGDVDGSTYINIGDGSGTNADGTPAPARRSAQVTGNVFGGGNNAAVTGQTRVVVGKQE